jgi:hypothetical protein
VTVFHLAMRADGIHVALHRGIAFHWVGHIGGLEGIYNAGSDRVREQCVL